MSRHIFACSTAGVFALVIGLAAQAPPAGGAQTPPAGGAQTQPPAAAAGGAASATVEGCLVKKATGEDYILASSKVLKGTAPAAPATPTGTTGAAAGSAAAAMGVMFDVRGLDAERLKGFEGKRVEIDGAFAAAAAGADDPADIRATAIRASASTATCPAAK